MAEHWACMSKVVVLILTLLRHTFQLAWCGDRVRVKPQTTRVVILTLFTSFQDVQIAVT